MKRRQAMALLALAPLGGCGFELRRWDLGSAFDTVAIRRARGVDLHRDLAAALRTAGIEVLAGGAAGADVAVELSRQRQQRRSTAVVAGRATEAELILEVAFAIHAADGRALFAEQVLRSARRANLDADNILGASAEQALLRSEMRADLVARMLRALGAVAKGHADARTHADQR